MVVVDHRDFLVMEDREDHRVKLAPLDEEVPSVHAETEDPRARPGRREQRAAPALWALLASEEIPVLQVLTARLEQPARLVRRATRAA